MREQLGEGLEPVSRIRLRSLCFGPEEPTTSPPKTPRAAGLRPLTHSALALRDPELSLPEPHLPELSITPQVVLDALEPRLNDLRTAFADISREKRELDNAFITKTEASPSRLDVKPTESYTHVLNLGAGAVRSLADRL